MEAVKDRVALIAGIGEIGEAVGLRFAKGGAKVAVADSDQGKVDSLVSKINAGGGEALGVVADPTRFDDVKKVVGEVVARFGRVDILVNNVDDPHCKDIAEMSKDDWDKAIDNNLSPVFLFTREVVGIMRKNNYGRVISIGSLDYLGWQGKANYSAARSAIFGFTRSLALELAKSGITVNYVAKGEITTAALSEEDTARIKEVVPVQRAGKPEDVAGVVGFFASDASKYLTGQTLFVCGGKSIHSSMSV